MPEQKTRPMTDQDWLNFSKYWFQQQPNYQEKTFGRGAIHGYLNPEGTITTHWCGWQKTFEILQSLDYPPGWKEAHKLIETYDWQNEYVIIFMDYRTADDGDYVRLIYGVVSNKPYTGEGE